MPSSARARGLPSGGYMQGTGIFSRSSDHTSSSPERTSRSQENRMRHPPTTPLNMPPKSGPAVATVPRPNRSSKSKANAKGKTGRRKSPKHQSDSKSAGGPPRVSYDVQERRSPNKLWVATDLPRGSSALPEVAAPRFQSPTTPASILSAVNPVVMIDAVAFSGSKHAGWMDVGSGMVERMVPARESPHGRQRTTATSVTPSHGPPANRLVLLDPLPYRHSRS